MTGSLSQFPNGGASFGSRRTSVDLFNVDSRRSLGGHMDIFSGADINRAFARSSTEESKINVPVIPSGAPNASASASPGGKADAARRLLKPWSSELTCDRIFQLDDDEI